MCSDICESLSVQNDRTKVLWEGNTFKLASLGSGEHVKNVLGGGTQSRKSCLCVYVCVDGGGREIKQ